MAELGDSSLTEVEVIAAVGDVILVVGPEKIRLRVHSLTLKATSQAFSAMLGSNWKEGRDLIGKGLVNLLLPEDNAMAMKYVCAIIHHQNKMLPNDMAPPDILDIAITADKYNFVDALRFASGSWLQSCNVKADELMTLTAAAYAFQNAQAFRDLTKALILNYGGSYFSLSTGKIESVMSWKVFCLLEEQRDITRLKLGDILINGVESANSCVHKCGWTSKYAFAYLKSLGNYKLLPTGLIDISEAIERVGMSENADIVSQ